MLSDTENALLLAIPLARAPALCGMSRSTIYRRAAAGELRLIKCGRTTLVDGQSLRDCLASLPPVVLTRATKTT